MKFHPAACFGLAVLFVVSPVAVAGPPSLIAEMPNGTMLHVMVPPTEEDVPSPEIWAQIRTSELMMSISIFEASNKKVGAFYKKQPCEFVRGKYLACDVSGDSPLAGTRYEIASDSQSYVCKFGCTAATPEVLSLREPVIFDMAPEGGLLIDQHES